MNATTHCESQSILRHEIWLRLLLATCVCLTAVALLAMPAVGWAGKIDPQTGLPQLTARQILRLDKLRADTRAVAARKALRGASEPLYRRVIPVRPSWLAPKGQR